MPFSFASDVAIRIAMLAREKHYVGAGGGVRRDRVHLYPRGAGSNPAGALEMRAR